MPCTTGIGNDRTPTLHEYQDTLEYFLCRACRHLSAEQLKMIIRHCQSRFTDRTPVLYEWYLKHLQEDIAYEDGHQHRPEGSYAVKELERLDSEVKNFKPKVYPY
jgi:hypothetical protein